MRVVLLVALLMMPTASALFDGFGTRVDSATGLREDVLSNGGPDDFVFFDDDGSGSANEGEAVFLARSGTIAPGDIWITTRPGERVMASDSVVDAGAGSVPGSLAFLDNDGDGSFGPGDLLVIDQSSSNQGILSAEDLILSGPDAGRFIRSGDIGNGAPVRSLSGQAGFIDDGDGVYEPGEAVVLDVDGNDRPTPMDILMHGSQAMGSRLGLHSAEVSLYLEETDGPDRFYYIDNDGDGQYDVGDPIYLGRSTAMGIGSVRIHGTDLAPGSIVTRSDGDARTPRTELSALIMIDGSDDRVDNGERIYLDIQDVGRAGSLDGTDIILSGPDAGKSLDDVGLAGGASMRSVGGTPRYIDMDGDAMYSEGDVIYYDGDQDRYVSIGDIQLVTIDGLMPEPVDEPDDDATDGGSTDGDGASDGGSDGGSDGAAGGDGGADGVSGGGATDGDGGATDGGAADEDDVSEPEIPGFGWIAALLGLAFWVRRR